MVKTCSVVQCVGGTLKDRIIRKSLNIKQASLFGIPKEATLLAQWSSILKKNLEKNHYICDFHFKEEDIVKSARHDFPDGNFQIIPRERWALLSNAVPMNSEPRKFDDEMSGNKCQFNRIDPTLRMSSFPANDTERCKKWILHSGNKNLKNVCPKSLNRMVICSNNFIKEQIVQKKLLKNVIPMKCSPSDLESEEDSKNENSPLSTMEISIKSSSEDSITSEDSTPSETTIVFQRVAGGLRMLSSLDSTGQLRPRTTRSVAVQTELPLCCCQKRK